MGNVQENLALNLRRLRDRAGLTKKELAVKAEVKETTIDRWEHQRQGFRLNNLKGVAKALDCSINDLIADPVVNEAVQSKEMQRSDKLIAIISMLPRLNDTQLNSMFNTISRQVHGRPHVESSALAKSQSKKANGFK